MVHSLERRAVRKSDATFPPARASRRLCRAAEDSHSCVDIRRLVEPWKRGWVQCGGLRGTPSIALSRRDRDGTAVWQGAGTAQPRGGQALDECCDDATFDCGVVLSVARAGIGLRKRDPRATCKGFPLPCDEGF